jgi:hypothetical protein
MSVVAAPRRAGARAATRIDRVTSALPLATVYVWLFFVYAWEAYGHVTPWLFTDELEMTQLSRSIAATGRAARRGEAHSFDSLWNFVIAPAWWIHDTGTAYDVVKWLGVAVMTSVLFPTYVLARTVVGPRLALFAATAAAVVPALVYSSYVIEEPLAYPYSAFALLLVVKAVTVRSRRWIVAATVVALVAPAVRGELVMVLATFILAWVWIAWQSPRGRAWRAGWNRWDWVGGALLLAGIVIFLNSWIGHQSSSWASATGYYKHRMIEYGLWAGGALTIGLGVLPVVAGLAALFGFRDRERTDAERGFVIVTVLAIATFGFYTAVKAAYISTVFSTLVEERNLTYLAPLLFIGTALFLEGRRLRPWVVAGSGAFALYMLLTTPYKMEFHFYNDAPGLSILQSANRNLALTPSNAKVVLAVALAVSVALCLLPRLLADRHRVLGWLLATTAALVLAWNFTGQVTAARSSTQFAHDLVANLPKPYDWIDRAIGSGPALYLGQHERDDPNGIWLLEFWNRSIRWVWSTDGTGVGPGPTVTPDVVKPDGELKRVPGVDPRYIVADEGVHIVGREVAREYHGVGGTQAAWRVIEIAKPLRLAESVQGLFPDGWAGADSSYARYSSPGGRPGFALVDVSRAGWNGVDVPGGVTVRIGTLKLDKHAQPQIAVATSTSQFTLHGGQVRRLVLPAPRPPFKVEVHITPTFEPHLLDPRNSDLRQLGAIVGFRFALTPPAKKQAPRLETGAQGVYGDGWQGALSAYNQVTPLPDRRTALVTISRRAWGGTDVPGHVRIVVGTLVKLPHAQARIGKVLAVRTWTVHAKGYRRFELPVPRGKPFRIEIRITPTFMPSELDPRITDKRAFGAQVGYGFR